MQTAKHKGQQVKVKEYSSDDGKWVGVAIKSDGKIGKARRVFKPSEVTHLWPQLDCEA